VNADRLLALQAGVDRLAVVDEDIGHEDVKVAAPVAVVAVPRLGLFGQAVDQDQRRLSSVGAGPDAVDPAGESAGHEKTSRTETATTGSITFDASAPHRILYWFSGILRSKLRVGVRIFRRAMVL